MEKIKRALALFLAFFKIGLFTFGGGYAMIAIMEREFVEKKKWIGHEEFIDVIAIAESTPGPIAINSATYIGYKNAGVLGSLFATLGVVLPSFIIIFCISLVFDKFLQFVWVQYAFRGIQACVVFLILSAGLKMVKGVKKTPVNLIMLILTILCLVGFSAFAIDFSSIFYILIGGVVGLTVYLIGYIKNRNKKKIEDKDDAKQGGRE
ncbi:MAG: chromate transporter [Clostridia bacterium]|nr:chromate transporter [Clostridia bacterium]